MANRWIAVLKMLLQPEDTSREDEKYILEADDSEFDHGLRYPAAKVLVWTVLAVMAGLFIGQLT